MLKKLLVVLTVVCMFATLLTGCLPDNKAAKSSAPAVSSSAAPASSAPAANKDAKIIRISNGSGDTFPPVMAQKEVFKKLVEEKTNGRYKVEIYISGQLGDDVKATEAVRQGSLDACVTSTAPLVGFQKELAIFDIPFLFTSDKVADAVLDGPLGQKLSDMLPSKGLVNLAWCENGFRHLTNSVREVKTPADLKGLKIRTMENPIHLAAWRALGANPTPMAWTEVFTALQQKSIDGQENPIPNFYSVKIHEVNKYITLTGHVYSPMLFLFSKKVWDTIPAEDQKIMIDAARQTALRNRQIQRESEVKLQDEIKKAGGIITTLTPEQKKQFQDLTAPVWNMVEEKVGADLIKDLKAEIAKATK